MASILNLLIAAGTAILSIRLLSVGLYRRYRIFFLYLIFETLHTGILASLGQAGRAYEKVWVVTEPLEWFFFALVVLEIYALVLQDYKGLSTVGRWSLIAAMVVAMLASGIILIAPSQYAQSHVITYYYVAERAVNLSLAVFLLSILGLLMRYPLTLSRNIVVHSMVFSVYFLANAVLYLLLSMAGLNASAPWVTYTISAITLAAIGTWLVMLNPAGEFRKQRVRPRWMPGQEEQLVNQLNHLNAALLRATGNRPK